jgi:tRNA threonylcarbamoyl adenosine modification protein (Sua5/YciO/YrdC/YwlC family)
MKTVIKPIEDGIGEAKEILLNGGVVGIPTETVYGLAALGTDSQAVKRIFEIKGRPSDNPLIAHVHKDYDLNKLVYIEQDYVKKLIEAFTPGPLTLVFKSKGVVCSEAVCGGNTLAVRMPSHKGCEKLLKAVDAPLVAPSANLSKHTSPVTAEHVYADLNGKLALILDGGKCSGGIESTVLDVTERIPRILRAGLITKEMIDILTEDGDITTEAAFVAILSEAFALRFDDPEDRVLIRDYLTHSVRLLDPEKYENNPYYKNIKIEELKDGNWEFRWESYAPYRGVIAADMKIYDDFKEIPPLGFFDKEFRFPAVLEDGNEWMTLTPVDLDTCEEAIAKAHGNVVTFGLGLGYYAYMASEKPEVKSVTVVELSSGIIRLFEKHLLPQMKNGHKIQIVNADAFDYATLAMPSMDFDVAFVDTWRDASDGTSMYTRMKELECLSPKTEFMYWIENFLRSRLRAERFAELYAMYENKSKNLPEKYEEIEKILKKI